MPFGSCWQTPLLAKGGAGEGANSFDPVMTLLPDVMVKVELKLRMGRGAPMVRLLSKLIVPLSTYVPGYGPVATPADVKLKLETPLGTQFKEVTLKAVGLMPEAFNVSPLSVACAFDVCG